LALPASQLSTRLAIRCWQLYRHLKIMSLPRELPSKKEVALMLLESSDVFIHLDPRKDHVVVPIHLRKQPHLILQVGLNMPVPIPDLEVDDDGISCTLSFNRSPFWCKLPWHSVYALVSKDARGMVWPDDVPPEVAVKFVKQAGDASGETKAPATPEPPAALAAPAEEPVRAPAKGRKPSTRKKRGAAATPKAVEAPPQAQVARPAVEALPTSPSEPPKRKRELPPYLRVVK
jgi:hypothetical protein